MSDSEPRTPAAGPDFVESAATQPPAVHPPAPAISPFPVSESLPTSFPAPGISPAQFAGPIAAPVPPPVPPAAANAPAPITEPIPAEPSPGSFPAPGITPPPYAASASASVAAGEVAGPAEPDVEWWKDQPPTERVGRGLLFSIGAIVIGVALTMIFYKIGFIASITSFVLAYAAIWLYTLGAGAAPRKGVWGVIAVILVGVALSIVSMLVTDVLSFLQEEFPDAALADKLDTIWYNLGRGEVWSDYATDIVMYVLFAGLGTFGLVRQLGRARKAA